VTLVGFSMGARLIFHCLLELARAPNRAGLGIVENVVLLGTPVSIRAERWTAARCVPACLPACVHESSPGCVAGWLDGCG
jgi:hypothetical protein